MKFMSSMMIQFYCPPYKLDLPYKDTCLQMSHLKQEITNDRHKDFCSHLSFLLIATDAICSSMIINATRRPEQRVCIISQACKEMSKDRYIKFHHSSSARYVRRQLWSLTHHLCSLQKCYLIHFYYHLINQSTIDVIQTEFFLIRY